MSRIKFYISMVVVFPLFVCSGCQDHDFFKLFQRDLKLNIVFSNHKHLYEGAPVLIVVSDEKKQKIGEVEKIAGTSTGLSSVRIRIYSEFRKQISPGRDFVLYNNPFGGETTHIMVVDSFNKYTSEPFEQGDTIRGKTYMEYRLGKAGEGLHKWLENITDKGNAVLKSLERELSEFDVDILKKQLDDLLNDVGKFSEKQRQAFEKNVLPEFKKKMEQIIRYFEDKIDEQELQELRDRYRDIEKGIIV